jgi:exopolysaccharide production protein ExoQ
LLCCALVLVVVLSVAVELFLPGYVPGSDLEGAAWHGVFGRKNEFGRMICLTVSACLSSVQRSQRLKIFIAAGGFVLALLSRSAGAVIYLSLMIAIIMMWSILRWGPKPRKLGIIATTIIAALSITCAWREFTRITYMIGKDPDMTGRVDLWILSIADIRDRPLLGYGYQAFWGVTSQPARRIREAVHWDNAPHSHNGYIDLTLSLGLVGMLAYALTCSVVARRAYAFLVRGPDNYRKWPLSLLALVLLYQLTESSNVTGNNILWMSFCSLAFSLGQPEEKVSIQESPLSRVSAA